MAKYMVEALFTGGKELVKSTARSAEHLPFGAGLIGNRASACYSSSTSLSWNNSSCSAVQHDNHNVSPLISPKLPENFTTSSSDTKKFCWDEEGTHRRYSAIHTPSSIEGELPEEEIKEQFSRITENLKKHEAYAHPLFKYMQEKAEENTLSSPQLDFFRHTMFTRIHPTVVSIAIQLSIAAKQGDYKTLWTAAQNVHEETGEGVFGKSHPEQCMLAFNTLAEKEFLLPNTTLVSEYEQQLTTKELHYHAVISDLYHRHPVLVSYAQELASAGNESTAGMMGDMYDVFFPYRGRIGTEIFDECIRPYFASHCNIESDSGRLLPTEDSVEDIHRQRAEEDVLRILRTRDDIALASVVMNSFAEAQNDLFSQSLENIQSLGVSQDRKPTPSKDKKELVFSGDTLPKKEEASWKSRMDEQNALTKCGVSF